MKMKDQQDEWSRGDDVWELLGKAAPKQASGRFTDDTVRAVKLLPEADAWGPRIVKFSPMAALAACAVFGVFFLIPGNESDVSGELAPVAEVSHEESWEQIEAVADAEVISAAVDHLDAFSDEELITMIGF
jgi:hypothetical protein